MKICQVCKKKITENGWGTHAYATDDGSQYIHHQCRPVTHQCRPVAAPTITPKPLVEAQGEPHNAPSLYLKSEYLTLPDAAALLGLSTETLRRRIKNQTLPAFRLDGGQTILIERAALLQLLHRL